MTYISVLIRDIESPMGKYLLCRKDGGKWQLPTDRIRSGETIEAATARTACEEVGLSVKPIKEQMHMHRKVPYNAIECTYVEASTLWGAEPEGEFAEFKWVRARELYDYEFEDMDARFMSKFIPWINADGSEIPGTRMH